MAPRTFFASASQPSNEENDLDIESESAVFIPLSPPDTHPKRRSYEVGSRGGSRWRRALGHAEELYDNNVGLLLIVASNLCGSVMNLSVKVLNSSETPVPTFEIVFVRMFCTWVLCMLYMLYAKVPDPLLGPKGIRWLLCIRGFSGFFGIFGIYYSLRYLSLSDAIVLTFLSPTTTAIAGYLLLREPFSRGQAVAGLCSLVGVILIARPEFLFGQHEAVITSSGIGTVDLHHPTDSVERGTPAQRLVAVGVALLGVLGATGAVTSLRALGRRVHTLHSLNYFSMYSMLVSMTGTIWVKDHWIIPSELKHIAALTVIGLFGFFTQVLLIMGLQRETASRGSLANYTQIVFATIFERMFFHVYPSWLSIIGTVIILASALYVALTKKSTSRSADLEQDWHDEAVDMRSQASGSADNRKPTDSELEKGTASQVPTSI